MVFCQIFVVVLCLQQIAAVVNQPSNTTESSKVVDNVDAKNVTNATAIPDLEAANSDQTATRRDAPFVLPTPSASYGLPLNTYGPPAPPVPVYGTPSNNFLYPGPPPDIPPPKFSYGPPPDNSPPKFSYGPPPRPPKPFNPQPFNYIHKNPKPFYGPPRPYIPPKFNFGPKFPKGKPKFAYGPPKFNVLPPIKFNSFPKGPVRYGPPEPVPHGPPHPGVPAPPTPPDIKYDGWQPIPGLVSRPPQDTYGVPNIEQHGGGGDLHFNGDFVPPPADIPTDYGIPLVGDIPTFQIQPNLDVPLPLPELQADPNLQIIKAPGFEIFPQNDHQDFNYLPPLQLTDTYGVPPEDSYVANGPYPAAQTFPQQLEVGLIPPSGHYGVPPNGQFGVPPNGQFGVPPSGHFGGTDINTLNALKVNPPKRPVIFREPVPVGLIESIGQNVAQKDAHGIIESSHTNSVSGPTYIPPPVPDLTKPLRPIEPTSLYSLPNPGPPISFKSVVQGNFDHGQVLTSYNAPSGIIDGSYGLDNAHSASSIDLTNLPIDYNGIFDNNHAESYSVSQTIPRSCPDQKPRSFSNYDVHEDLQTAHSQKSISVSTSNKLQNVQDEKDVHHKTVLSNFGPGAELVKSQSVGYSSIPVQGNLGSYTLQIQSSDGTQGGVPHDQILSEELLQSILAAIEKPQQQQQQQFVVQETSVTLPPEYSVSTSVSVKNETAANTTEDIALYFRNDVETASKSKVIRQTSEDNVKNAQQYGKSD